MEAYAFISYAHSDQDRVEGLICFLRESYRIWLDSDINAATEYNDQIAERIENTEIFIACISENYLASDYCMDEIMYARSMGRPVLLVFFENVSLPRGLKLRVNRYQCLYITDPNFSKKIRHGEEISRCLIQEERESKPQKKRTEAIRGEKKTSHYKFTAILIVCGIVSAILFLRVPALSNQIKSRYSDSLNPGISENAVTDESMEPETGNADGIADSAQGASAQIDPTPSVMPAAGASSTPTPTPDATATAASTRKVTPTAASTRKATPTATPTPTATSTTPTQTRIDDDETGSPSTSVSTPIRSRTTKETSSRSTTTANPVSTTTSGAADKTTTGNAAADTDNTTAELSVSARNTNAHKEYAYLKEKLKEEHGSFAYIVLDITGDGVDEMLVQYSRERVYMDFAVYTYSDKKVKKILSEYAGYGGYVTLTCYKKTCTIICEGYGHGNRWFDTYSRKKDKLVRAATKGGNYSTNYEWVYTNGDKSISEKKYNSILKPLRKGNKKVITYDKWKTYD